VEGKVTRGGWVKLFRPTPVATRATRESRAITPGVGQQVWEGRITSLKHFKEDVREIVAGQECGIGLEGFEDFQPGDTMETYRLEREEI
jgi:translation initiation factor IF-2